MKVTIEGTAEELLNLAGLLVSGRATHRSIGAPKNTDASQRDVRDLQTGDAVPNRYREEGVQ